MRRPIPGGMLLSSQWKSALEVQKETGHEEEYHQRKGSEAGKEPEGGAKALEGAAHDRDGSGRQNEPLLHSRRKRGDSEGRQRRHNESGDDAAVRPAEAMPGRAGSGHAFAVDQPSAEDFGARSDRGQSPAVETDQREQPEKRPGRCRDAGATGACG